jgi:hypothetical protein
MAGLKKLEITGSGFTDASIPFILQAFPNLESLSLPKCSIYFKEIPENLARSYTLKKLDLHCCCVEQEGLENIVALFPFLENLGIYIDYFEAPEINAERIISALKNLPHLKRLHIPKWKMEELECHLPNVKISREW